MPCSPSSRSSTLHRICQIASEIQLKNPYPQERRPRSTTYFHSRGCDAAVVLPYPGSLAVELEASGLDTNTAEKLSTAYTTAAARLKGRCELFLKKHYQNPNSQISHNSVSVAETIISRRYHSMLRHWKQVAFETAHSTPRTSLVPTGKSRPTFNHDSVPLLERYFNYNAYPSAVDRAILAEKTSLTHRQVEVWFQNHRNRAKKTGNPRARLAGPTFPWDDVEDTSRDTKQPLDMKLIKPELPPSSKPIRLISDTVNILEKFDPPKDAFPAPFSNSQSTQPDLPTSLYNPNEWYRHPTCKRPSPTGTSIDVLCDSFQTCLNLRRRCQTVEDKSKQDSERPWYPATYTYLYPSHHPAMLRRSRRRVRTSSPLLYSFHKPVPHTPSTNLQKDGFLRYCCQPSTLTGSLSSNQTGGNVLQLRRRTSASSMDSSVGCLTPLSSPSVSIIHLQTDSADLPFANVWDKNSDLYTLSPVFMRNL